jgi:hypothetical protein
MELLAPSEPLAPFVRRFNAYAERDTGFARRRELPSRLATLVFNLGADLRVEHPPGTRTTFHAGGAFYTGLSAAYAVTETDRAQEGAQVMLTALGARRLLGFPLGEVGDRLIDPSDLLGAAARNMADRLQEMNSPAGRLAILENEMTRRLALARDGPPRDAGRLHLLGRCRVPLRAGAGGRRGNHETARGSALRAQLHGARPRGSSLVLHHASGGRLTLRGGLARLFGRSLRGPGAFVT